MASHNIVLIGFMGAGKSAVGAALAAAIGYELFDTDIMVARAAGRSIPEIFDAEGEDGFRRRESDAISRATEGERRVIACGGGALSRNEAALRAAGRIVYLRADPETLRARVGSGEGRPMLEGGPERFEQLLSERAPRYEAVADLVVDTDAASPQEVAQRIAEAT